MLPHEKALVKRLESEPFALLGINSDGPADELRPRLESEGIAWRQAVDGATDGPLAKAWNVQSWPTIYILDGQGRIRYRDLRDQAMEDAVLGLLAEMKAEK